jgi:hypothetical protein
MSDRALGHLRAAAESAARWLQASETAAELFGRDSLAHNLVREQFSIDYGAEYALAEEAAGASVREEYGLPPDDEWTAFWPAAEQEAYSAAVARARTDEGARADAQRTWARVSKELLARHGEEWRAAGYDVDGGLPAPDWLAG